MTLLRLLHLVGSSSDDFYCDLSLEYAKCCVTDTAYFSSQYDFRFAYITPSGEWRFPTSLTKESIDNAKPMSLSQAIEYIKSQNIDVVLPHMYCIPGMTHYRGLFDILKIPYIGNTPEVMAITAHKGKTKAIVAAAGVSVPPGEVLHRGDCPTVSPPVVVKPASADNSLGVSLVKDVSEYDEALKKAFIHADEIIVEKFIEPGREVRCGIIVKDGEIMHLPIEEFLIDTNDRPIRTYSDKFPHLDENGKFCGWKTSEIKQSWIIEADDPIIEKVNAAAKKCHLALGCRHYSMFDFRIDSNGDPWFLEAGLYCSFGYGSGLPHTAKSIGIPLDKLMMIMINETLRKSNATNNTSSCS